MRRALPVLASQSRGAVIAPAALYSAALVLAVVGCNDHEAGRSPPPPPPPHRLAGVAPDQWRCESIAPIDALRDVLGGAVRQLESTAQLQPGLAQPCTYEVKATAVERWTFDLDCRPAMKQRADTMFAQYEASSRAQVEEYRRQPDAGVRPSDAGPPARPPEPAVEVAVGARGLDHHGQGLLFIDDDAPCYVRVLGPDAARRLALASLLARNLTPANAPMTPRAAP